MIKLVVSLIAVLVLLACTPRSIPPSVNDVSRDHVRIQTESGVPATGVVESLADRTCAVYGRRAVNMSSFCPDAYCLTTNHLFACVDKRRRKRERL